MLSDATAGITAIPPGSEIMPLTRLSASKVPPSAIVNVMILSPSSESRISVALTHESSIIFQYWELAGMSSGYVMVRDIASPLSNPVTFQESSPCGNDNPDGLFVVESADSATELTDENTPASV